MRRLASYAWPGNIRELQNVIERAVVLSTGSTLEIDARMLSAPATSAARAAAPKARRDSLEDVERRHIEAVLRRRRNWKIEGERGAAKILDLNPSTLRSRMNNLDIKRPS